MFNLEKAIKAIRQENLDGWLFYNVEHRDRISDLILGIYEQAVNSRPWIYVVFARADPVKLVHTIEAGILDTLPGRKFVYSSWDEYLTLIKRIGKGGRGRRLGLNFSRWNPFASFVDYGTVETIKASGFDVFPGDNLINRFLGTLSRDEIRSHEEAARFLYRIVFDIWARLEEALKAGNSPREVDVQSWITGYFGEYGLVAEDSPIVAVDKNSGDPHYESGCSGGVGGESGVIKRGMIVQFDLWARLEKVSYLEDSLPVYADISWVGYTGKDIPDRYVKAFEVVCSARDRGVDFINRKLASGKTVTGAEVDAVVRSVIVEAGYGDYLRHRTGHSIGSRVHGFGVNLDSIEFPDRRELIEGSCFSVEPGVYFPDFGVRTEIDVYIDGGKAVISGGSPQHKILTMDL